MGTDSDPWTNKYIENIAIDDLKMTSSGQKNVQFFSNLMIFPKQFRSF